jgi:hypothetical protein
MFRRHKILPAPVFEPHHRTVTESLYWLRQSLNPTHANVSKYYYTFKNLCFGKQHSFNFFARNKSNSWKVYIFHFKTNRIKLWKPHYETLFVSVETADWTATPQEQNGVTRTTIDYYLQRERRNVWHGGQVGSRASPVPPALNCNSARSFLHHYNNHHLYYT